KAGGPVGDGLDVVLTDAKVSQAGVLDAFRRVAEAVRDRPQDKVVVFLAGHTGVFDSRRFCLLLPGFPFPDTEPLLVAARDAVPLVAAGARVGDEGLLRYE